MFFNFGMQEMAIVGMVAVLLFGKRLPEVARSLGGSYREFRKGLAEMQAHMQIDDSTPSVSSTSSYYADDIDDYEQPTAPKFEPPTSEPTAESDASSTSEPSEKNESTPSGEPTEENSASSTSEPTEGNESTPSSEPTREEG